MMPPRSLHKRPYRARPWGIDAPMSAVCVQSSSARALAPSTKKRPMWETSKTPAVARTALASARMLSYCTGMS